MARRVFVHVGAPKTGTSFVQDILFAHTERLDEAGICYPGDRFDAHFLAALDLMQLSWGGLEAEAVGAWDALAGQIRAWPETAIVSHEILGRASRLQVDRALASFGDAEVHVVMSARDLVRQIPAEWQENVKHRRTKTYADFLDDLRDPRRTAEIAQWFWAVQEIPDVLLRWGATLPPERVHLVTVPPPGADRGLLWRRISGVLGVDGLDLPTESERANASLGVAESALVRRINEQVNDTMPGSDYRPVIRELLVHRTLATRPPSARLSVPAPVAEWATTLSEQWVDELAGRGYDVVGDLADLVPGPPPPFIDPDHPDEAQVSAAGVEGIVALAEEVARLRAEEARIHADNADLMRQIDAWHATRGYRAKERLVDLADTNPLARLGLSAYRRARGDR